MSRFYNQTKNTVLAKQGMIAESLGKRLKGWLGKKEVRPGEGLLLTNCNSIHTFFMHFPLDIIFLDRYNKAIKLVQNLKPYKISPYVWRAKQVLELPVGTVARTKTQIGDEIIIGSDSPLV